MVYTHLSSILFYRSRRFVQNLTWCTLIMDVMFVMLVQYLENDTHV